MTLMQFIVDFNPPIIPLRRMIRRNDSSNFIANLRKSNLRKKYNNKCAPEIRDVFIFFLVGRIQKLIFYFHRQSPEELKNQRQNNQKT